MSDEAHHVWFSPNNEQWFASINNDLLLFDSELEAYKWIANRHWQMYCLAMAELNNIRTTRVKSPSKN